MILERRIGFPVTLVEHSADQGRMLWVVFCNGAEVCEIEKGSDCDTVPLPKFLTSENTVIMQRLALMRGLQRREHALSYLLTMRPDLANDVAELYSGESDGQDPRALLKARRAIDGWRGRLRSLCFEQLTDLDVERLLEEFSPEGEEDH